MGLWTIALALAARLVVDAVTLKQLPAKNKTLPIDLDFEEEGQRDLMVKSDKSNKKKSKTVKSAHKKRKVTKVVEKAAEKSVEMSSMRSVEAEGETIVLEASEMVNPTLAAHNAEENHPVVQTLRSDEGMAYYGEIRVGGQTQQGIYDTGSFDLVVLSACTRRQKPKNRKTHEPICCARQACPKANYSMVLSGNWKKSDEGLTKITYGSGPVTVVQGYDHIEFKSDNGANSVSDDDVPTKVIVDHQVDLFRETDLQAIVGLAPGKFEERANRMTTHLGMKRFMVCFNEDAKKDGVITWNDKDRSNDPAYVAVPAIGKLFWATKLVNFRLTDSQGSVIGEGDFEGCQPSCGAVIDTGTSLLSPPKEVIQQISKLLDEGHITDCSDMKKFPTLTFSLGDKEFSLPPEAYIGEVDEDEATPGFKHKSLAFPLLPLRSSKQRTRQMNHTLALKQNKTGPVELKVESEKFPTTGACAIMMSEGDPEDGTPWGPMVIFGMQLFRKYAVQFDITGDHEGTKPSLANPTRIMRFTEASPDCTTDSKGKQFNLRQKEGSAMRSLVGSKLQKVNLKKIRKSTFRGHLDESRQDSEYKINGFKFRYKNMVRI